MKTKNFPARKLRRQLIAAKRDIDSEHNQALLENARGVRTKKKRSNT